MRSSSPHKSKRSRLSRLLLLFLGVLLFIGIALFLFLPPEKSPLKKIENTLNQDKSSAPENMPTVKEKPLLALPAKEEHVVSQEIVPQEDQEEKIEPSFDPAVVPPSLQNISTGSCDENSEKLYQFFQKVETKEYMQTFAINIPLQDHFLHLTKKLLENPPVVSRETDDLYTLLTNMAHFFRIIGKDNIVLIKTILGRERDQIEDIAQYLHNTLSRKSCAKKQYQLDKPVEKIYEYAAFFLNTMGGRSYLFRRESRSRLLVNYYAVLILEQANDLELNYHGINLAEYLPFLIKEIEGSNQLVYKELYLDNLYALAERYE